MGLLMFILQFKTMPTSQENVCSDLPAVGQLIV